VVLFLCVGLFAGQIEPEEAVYGGFIRIEVDPDALSRYLKISGVPVKLYAGFNSSLCRRPLFRFPRHFSQAGRLRACHFRHPSIQYSEEIFPGAGIHSNHNACRMLRDILGAASFNVPYQIWENRFPIGIIRRRDGCQDLDAIVPCDHRTCFHQQLDFSKVTPSWLLLPTTVRHAWAPCGSAGMASTSGNVRSIK